MIIGADLDWKRLVKESFSEKESLKIRSEEFMKVNHMKRPYCGITFHSKRKAYVKSLRYDRAWGFPGTESRPLILDHRSKGKNSERCQKNQERTVWNWKEHI